MRESLKNKLYFLTIQSELTNKSNTIFSSTRIIIKMLSIPLL